MTTLAISEKQFQAQVVELAEMLGWTVNHTRKSIGGRKQGWVTATTLKGMPDLMLVKPPRLIFAELKVATGLTPEQEHVLALLDGVSCVEVFTWRPENLERIALILRGEP